MKKIRERVPLRERAVKALEFPQELVLPKVTVFGSKRATVENYRCVVEYEKESVRVMTADFLLHFQGENMEIAVITDERLELEGKICRMEFLY